MNRAAKWLPLLSVALVLLCSNAQGMIVRTGLPSALPSARDFNQNLPTETQSTPPAVPDAGDIRHQPQPGDILLARDILGYVWIVRVESVEVHNGEIRYALSPSGLCTGGDDSGSFDDFFYGITSSWFNDNTLGVPFGCNLLENPSNMGFAASAGAVLGHAVAAIQSVVEMAAGLGMTGGGATLGVVGVGVTATGVGAPVGVPATAVGGGLTLGGALTTLHGGTVMWNSGNNLLAMFAEGSRSKPGSLGEFKGRDALRAENRIVRDAARASGLEGKDNLRRLHDSVSGQGLTFHEIVEIAKDILKGRF